MSNKSKYLIAIYYKNPRDPSKTHLKGFWANEDNYQFDEQLTFATSLKDRDITNGHIILDLLDEKVVKNRTGDRDYAELYAYFYEAFNKQIDEFMGRRVT